MLVACAWTQRLPYERSLLIFSLVTHELVLMSSPVVLTLLRSLECVCHLMGCPQARWFTLQLVDGMADFGPAGTDIVADLFTRALYGWGNAPPKQVHSCEENVYF